MASAPRLVPVQPAAPPEPVRACRTRTPLNAGQVARTLEDLIQLGFIEAVTDEHNITRYRPLLVAKRRIA